MLDLYPDDAARATAPGTRARHTFGAMHRPSALVALLLLGLALACADPFDAPPPPSTPAADVKTPAPAEDTEEPPPGGWIRDGVIYAADGTIYGCVGGGNWCAGPPPGEAPQAEPAPLDLCADVDAIRDAELDHRDRSGAFRAVKPTPRSVDELDATAVPWPAKSGFAAIGWSPGGPTRATYWVDASGDGFEVHGLAKNADGTYAHCFATAELGAVDTPWRPR
ncbi:MAG: hypothetical protein ACK4YP_13840 [Myxococcota bacterium]